MRENRVLSLDSTMSRLKEAAPKWASLPVGEKVKLLDQASSCPVVMKSLLISSLSLKSLTILVLQIKLRLLHRTGTWAKRGAELRGLANDPLSVGVETLNACLIPAYYIPSLIHTYKQLETKAENMKELRTTPDGSKVVKVWPISPSDLRTCSVALPDVEAMLYLQV